jgi:hypothetical protein
MLPLLQSSNTAWLRSALKDFLVLFHNGFAKLVYHKLSFFVTRLRCSGVSFALYYSFSVSLSILFARERVS